MIVSSGRGPSKARSFDQTRLTDFLDHLKKGISTLRPHIICRRMFYGPVCFTMAANHFKMVIIVVYSIYVKRYLDARSNVNVNLKI